MRYLRANPAIRLLGIACIILPFTTLRAVDLADSVSVWRSYLKALDNARYQFEVEASLTPEQGERTYRGTDELTFSSPRLKVIRNRSNNSRPVTKEEFVFDGSSFQALTNSRVLLTGKNPETFRMRLDLENPLLMPLAFAYYRKGSHELWQEMLSDATWDFFIKNAQIVKNQNGRGVKIQFRGGSSTAQAVECEIELDPSSYLPQKWTFAHGKFTGEVSITAWKKNGISFPIPQEISFKNFSDGKPILSARYRLLSVERLDPKDISGDKFRINAESAKEVVDTDENISFFVEEK